MRLNTRKFIEKNSFELLTIVLFIGMFKLVLLGFNIFGNYNFNDLFLGKIWKSDKLQD